MTTAHKHTFDITGTCECGFIAPGSKTALAQASKERMKDYTNRLKAEGKIQLHRWVTPEQRDDIDAYLSGTK